MRNHMEQETTSATRPRKGLVKIVNPHPDSVSDEISHKKVERLIGIGHAEYTSAGELRFLRFANDPTGALLELANMQAERKNK